jgi:hypothetical protein
MLRPTLPIVFTATGFAVDSPFVDLGGGQGETISL